MPNVRIDTSSAGVRTICIDREEKRNALERAKRIVLVPRTEDAREGVSAFFDERSPVWKGR